ncbi:MAG: hypothetical protein IPK26_01000 [Planctomycetes bacterium]|nr:hypothetical protein [Planctomycetota bacterium]
MVSDNNERSSGIWIGALLALLVAAFGGWQWRRASAARHEAELARVRAEAAHMQAEVEVVAATIAALPGAAETPDPAPGEWAAVTPREMAEITLRAVRNALAAGDLETARQNLQMLQMAVAGQRK